MRFFESSSISRRNALVVSLATATWGAAAAAGSGLLAGSLLRSGSRLPAQIGLSAVLVVLAGAALALFLPWQWRVLGRARDTAMHQARFLAAANATGDALLLLEPIVVNGAMHDFRITYLNAKARGLFKLPAETLLGGNLCALLPFFRTERLFEQFCSIILSGKPSTAEFSLNDERIDARSLRSSVVQFEHGLVLSLTNLTEQKVFESVVAQAHHHDALTGLPNRVLLDDRLQQVMARAKRCRHSAAVLILDVDGFKDLNERSGRAAGDHVLKTLAKRLRGAVRSSDSVFRIGSDEFVIVFGDLASADLAASLARKVVLSLLPPVKWRTQSFDISVSLGVALYPDGGSTPESLLVEADMQMYRMKRAHQVRANVASAAMPEPQRFLTGINDVFASTGSAHIA
jgi:diguanylate cyclase (GGDEF)-like protein